MLSRDSTHCEVTILAATTAATAVLALPLVPVLVAVEGPFRSFGVGDDVVVNAQSTDAWVLAGPAQTSLSPPKSGDTSLRSSGGREDERK